MVHNGIIENYQEIKEKLLKYNYTFYSQTDTEGLVKYVDYYYKKYGMGPIDAIAKTMVRVRGSYALAVMFKDFPGEIYVARKDSPMILGVENGESYIASDVPAILKYARNVYYIGSLEMARVRAGEVTFFNLDGDEVVGMINLRPKAESHVYLRQYGGHIGYSVKPSRRKQGIGTMMLRDMLKVCRDEFELDRVLITCIKENEASRRVIMNNGGVYESDVFYPPEEKYMERYWISL